MQNKILRSQIKIFLYFTPVIYAVAAIIGSSSLYAIKDLLMYLIVIQIVLHDIRKNQEFPKSRMLLIVTYTIYVIISSTFRMEDAGFWLVGFREICVTPLSLMIIGGFLNNCEENLLNLLKGSLLFSCVLTTAFALLFRAQSFGSTNRLSSFWDSEHEPGIIGGLFITICIVDYLERKKMRKRDIVCMLLSGFLMILSKSRSVFIAISLSLAYLLMKKPTVKKAMSLAVLIVVFVLFWKSYDTLMNRSIDYNLTPRIEQYSMAFHLVSENLLFGIGIDKYGVMGNLVKVFRYDNYSTTTMDSSLLKYMLNLGLIFCIVYFIIIHTSYEEIKKTNSYIFAIVIFGLCMGLVTGKLGSYPLNQYFYIIVGYYFLRDNRIAAHATPTAKQS